MMSELRRDLPSDLKFFEDKEFLSSAATGQTVKSLYQAHGRGIIEVANNYLQEIGNIRFPVYYQELKGINPQEIHRSNIYFMDSGYLIKIKKKPRYFGNTLREFGNLQIANDKLARHNVKTPLPVYMYKVPTGENGKYLDGLGMTIVPGRDIMEALGDKYTRKDASKKLGMLMGVFAIEGVLHKDLHSSDKKKTSHILYNNGNVGVIDFETAVFIDKNYKNFHVCETVKMVDRLFESERKRAKLMIFKANDRDTVLSEGLFDQFDAGLDATINLG